MYTNNRDAYRQTFFNAWQKYQKKLPLEPVEAQLVEVMLAHPDYHAFLDRPVTFQQQEFALEENPFFHMSLHLALQDQIRTNRPDGIADIYTQLLTKYTLKQDVEHMMMNCLIQVLAQVQQTGQAPDEAVYLNKLKALLL